MLHHPYHWDSISMTFCLKGKLTKTFWIYLLDFAHKYAFITDILPNHYWAFSKKFPQNFVARPSKWKTHYFSFTNCYLWPSMCAIFGNKNFKIAGPRWSNCIFIGFRNKASRYFNFRIFGNIWKSHKNCNSSYESIFKKAGMQLYKWTLNSPSLINNCIIYNMFIYMYIYYTEIPKIKFAAQSGSLKIILKLTYKLQCLRSCRQQ